MKDESFTQRFVPSTKSPDFGKGMVINMENKKFSLKEIGLPKLILVLVIGMFLILSSFPSMFSKKEKDNKDLHFESQQGYKESEEDPLESHVSKMEEKLKDMLKKVYGVGDVEVMITLKASKEKIVLKDNPYTKESLNEVDGEGGSRANEGMTNNENTVLVTNEQGGSIPYIIQEIEPEIEGVLVIASGGNNPKVITEIVEAINVLYGIPAYKVKVMKINDN